MKLGRAITIGLVLFYIGCNRNSDTQNTVARRDDSGAAQEPSGAGQNSQHGTNTTIVATDQSNSRSDHELTRRIQDGLRRSPALASAADKVRVISVNGQITLQGSVSSTQQVAAIGEEAKKLAGTNAVHNVLEVHP